MCSNSDLCAARAKARVSSTESLLPVACRYCRSILRVVHSFTVGMQLALAMQQPACALLLLIAALSNLLLLVDAAPPTLQSRIQAYLQSQGVNASIPTTSAYNAQPNARLNTVSITCGILNAYRDWNLVTPQDGQLYTTQAEQHW